MLRVCIPEHISAIELSRYSKILQCQSNIFMFTQGLQGNNGTNPSDLCIVLCTTPFLPNLAQVPPCSHVSFTAFCSEGSTWELRRREGLAPNTAPTRLLFWSFTVFHFRFFGGSLTSKPFSLLVLLPCVRLFNLSLVSWDPCLAVPRTGLLLLSGDQTCATEKPKVEESKNVHV